MSCVCVGMVQVTIRIGVSEVELGGHGPGVNVLVMFIEVLGCACFVRVRDCRRNYVF